MSTRKTARTGEPPPDQGFEASLERLEKIVAEMESGSLNLENMIARFEEGQRLIGLCTRKLHEVERKIEVLVKKGDSVAYEPLDTVQQADEGPGDEEAELF